MTNSQAIIMDDGGNNLRYPAGSVIASRSQPSVSHNSKAARSRPTITAGMNSLGLMRFPPPKAGALVSQPTPDYLVDVIDNAPIPAGGISLTEKGPGVDELRIRGAGVAAGLIGQVLLAEHTDKLMRHLAEVMRERPTPRKRDPMSLTPELFDALEGVPIDTLAAAMLRGCIDAQGIKGQRAPPQVKIKIGQALELPARGVAVRKALSKKDWVRLNRHVARKLSLYKKRRVEYAILKAANVAVEPWPRTLVAAAGAFACDMLLTALPDVCVEENSVARILTEAANAIEIDLRQVPVREPKTEPPQPWFGFDGIDGETFVAACTDIPAVRDALHQGIPHLDAVNYLQAIPWLVNEHTLDVVKRRHLLKKVKTPVDESLLEANIDLADRFRGQRFYIPLQVEFRGRLLPGSTLNFTGPDHVRGLFRLAEPAPITERGIYWLKVAGATAYDEDKKVSKLPSINASNGLRKTLRRFARPAAIR